MKQAIVTESKGMQKIPKFEENQNLPNSTCSKLYFFSKRFCYTKNFNGSQKVCKKTPDFDAKLRPYTKNFNGSQKVCKKTPDFDSKWRPYTKFFYGSQKMCKKLQILTQS